LGYNSEGSCKVQTTPTVTYYLTLTTGMKANGFQVKAYSKSETDGAGSASWTNINITVTLVP
jgi:hypothetical protein